MSVWIHFQENVSRRRCHLLMTLAVGTFHSFTCISLPDNRTESTNNLGLQIGSPSKHIGRVVLW